MYNNNRNIHDKYVCYCRKKSLEKRRENKMTASHWYGKTKYPNDYTTDKEYRDFLEQNGKDYLAETQQHIVKYGVQQWIRSYQNRDLSGDLLLWEVFKEKLIKSGDTILDVGCNCGHHCFRMCFEGYKAIGLEPSISLVVWAKEFAHQNNIQNVNFIVATANDLLALNLDIDIVFTKHTLEHYSNPLQALVNFRQVAKYGICGIVPNEEDKHEFRGNGQHLWRFSEKVLQKLLKEAQYSEYYTKVIHVSGDTPKLGYWAKI